MSLKQFSRDFIIFPLFVPTIFFCLVLPIQLSEWYLQFQLTEESVARMSYCSSSSEDDDFLQQKQSFRRRPRHIIESSSSDDDDSDASPGCTLDKTVLKRSNGTKKLKRQTDEVFDVILASMRTFLTNSFE